MTVLVTRPGVEGQSLCQQLADEGIQAIHHPLIRIIDNPDSANLSVQLNNSDIIIAVSHHAVTAAQNILSKTSCCLAYFAALSWRWSKNCARFKQSL